MSQRDARSQVRAKMGQDTSCLKPTHPQGLVGLHQKDTRADLEGPPNPQSHWDRQNVSESHGRGELKQQLYKNSGDRGDSVKQPLPPWAPACFKTRRVKDAASTPFLCRPRFGITGNKYGKFFRKGWS